MPLRLSIGWLARLTWRPLSGEPGGPLVEQPGLRPRKARKTGVPCPPWRSRPAVASGGNGPVRQAARRSGRRAKDAWHSRRRSACQPCRLCPSGQTA